MPSTMRLTAAHHTVIVQQTPYSWLHPGQHKHPQQQHDWQTPHDRHMFCLILLQLLQARPSSPTTQAPYTVSPSQAQQDRAAAHKMQVATVVVPAGEGRMVVLQAPPTAKYNLRARFGRTC